MARLTTRRLSRFTIKDYDDFDSAIFAMRGRSHRPVNPVQEAAKEGSYVLLRAKIARG